MNHVSGLITAAHGTPLAFADDNTTFGPGLVAFLIIVAMGLALWGLLRSMGKQLGRAKQHFEAEEAAFAAAAAPVADGVPAPKTSPEAKGDGA